MKHAFPIDADGDVLHSLVACGNDLSKPMAIDFQVAVPDEGAALGLAEAARKLGYRVRTYASPGCSLPWTCECSMHMLADYDGVTAVQAKLAGLAKPFRGHPDGWGSFGNNTDESHAVG